MRYLVRQYRTVTDSRGRVFKAHEEVDMTDVAVQNQQHLVYVVEDAPPMPLHQPDDDCWGASEMDDVNG